MHKVNPDRQMHVISGAAGVVALILVATIPHTADAQSLDASADEIRQVVQIPVAVARATEAGADRDELAAIMRELRLGRAPPADVIEILRVAPGATAHRFPTRLRLEDDGMHLSERVRFFRQQGVYGQALAREIHSELRAQGIPAGEAGARRGPPPMARGFISPEARRGPPAVPEAVGRMERREAPEEGPAPARPPGRSDEPPRGPPAGTGPEREQAAPAERPGRESGRSRGRGSPPDAGRDRPPTSHPR